MNTMRQKISVKPKTKLKKDKKILQNKKNKTEKPQNRNL